MHRRFQIDLDISGTRSVKYSNYLSALIGCIDKYDNRGIAVNNNNFKHWEINSYYAGMKIISPYLEINPENYELLEKIYHSLETTLSKYTSFDERRITYNLEVFDLHHSQIVSLIQMFFSFLPVFRKMNRESELSSPFNFDLSAFDPEKIAVQQTDLYKLYEEYFLMSVSKFRLTGMVSFSIALSTFKNVTVLNWLKLFNCMVEKCKNLPEGEGFSSNQFNMGKELIRQLDIISNNKPLSDWIIEKCAE